MSWRGRPLTSHEVVVKSIAATRTSRVVAGVQGGLDTQSATASCSTEVAHVGEPASRAQRRQAMLQRLADLRLTGMTGTQLERLAAALAPAQAVRAQQRHSQQRSGRRVPPRTS